MGFFDFLSRRSRPRLAKPTADAAVLELDFLRVHPAESLIIVTVGAGAVEAIRAAAAAGQAVVLTDGTHRVHLVPGGEHDVPVKDPHAGWVIPVAAPARAAIASQLRPMAGGYEISEQLAFMVE